MGLLLAAFSAAPELAAEEYRLLPVAIESEHDGQRFTVSQARDEMPFARCQGACALWLWPGEYWVTVGATQDTVKGTARIELVEPSLIRVKPVERDGVSGLALAILGGAVLVGGFAIIAAVRADDEERGDILGGILGLMLVGGGATMLGIGLGRSNRTTPKVEIERWQADETR